jgi:hypothetical protein
MVGLISIILLLVSDAVNSYKSSSCSIVFRRIQSLDDDWTVTRVPFPSGELAKQVSKHLHLERPWRNSNIHDFRRVHLISTILTLDCEWSDETAAPCANTHCIKCGLKRNRHAFGTDKMLDERGWLTLLVEARMRDLIGKIIKIMLNNGSLQL